MAAPDDPALTHARRPVRYYGCTRCQAWHREGDPLFAPHLFWQEKHGVHEEPATSADVFRRLVESDGPEPRA